MTLKIKEIKRPIALEMETFEKKFRKYMKTKVVLLDKIMSYIVKRKGKQIRPMFVFLSAGLCGAINEATYRGASMIELLHTASLVHDDVIDEANYRRNFFSINALWKNKIAVLVGDYLLSRGLLLSVQNEDFGFLRVVSSAMQNMSEGELLQMEKTRRLNITEDVYYEVIRKKTASLISSCCEIGALSVGAKKEELKKLKIFGEKVGIAFQIKDDLFDFGDQEIGKPLGIDIKEKKMTLPLIKSLNDTSSKERRKILTIIRKYSKDNQKVKQVIEFVRDSGGIDYAKTVMNKYFEEAIEILETFEVSSYRSSLSQLVRFTIERTV